MHVGTASRHRNGSLIRYQSSNPLHAIVVPPTIPQPIRSSVHKWCISNGSAAARSVRPGAVSDDILSLGMSAFQERRKRGAQAAAICRLPQLDAACGAVGVLTTPVRTPSLDEE
jgi:hypothetical protein